MPFTTFATSSPPWSLTSLDANFALVDKLFASSCTPESFGAVADGATDCTVAIQTATNNFKTVLFGPGVYIISAPISLAAGSACNWIGSRSLSSIIRNNAGTNVISVPNGDGNKGPYLIQNLRLGGTGTGIASSSGGYTVYVDNLKLRSVHFEGDLLYGINANLILADIVDCTFGAYANVGSNANGVHIKSQSGGGNQTNLNRLVNCVFSNGLGAHSIEWTDGFMLRFEDCAWEANVKDLITSSVSNIVLDNCFSELGNPAGGILFDFGASSQRVKVLGGQYNGSSMAAASSVFGVIDATSIIVEDAVISTSAAAFAYKNTTSASHTLPTHGRHHFKNVRVAGNAADPLLYLDSLIEDGSTAWTPAPTNLTVVNGTGGATYSGTYSIRNRLSTVTIRITTTGTCTTAAVAGTTFFTLPTGLPVPAVPCDGAVTNELDQATGTSLGNGTFKSGRFYCPTWGAQQGNITISGTYMS